MKNIILTILLSLFASTGWCQNLSSGSISGVSANNGAAQQSGAGYLDYVSGAKRPLNKNQIINLTDFSGGLDSQQNPVNLPNNEAQIAQNVRFDTQLKSVAKRSPILVYGTASAGNPINGLFRYYSYSGAKVLLANYLSTIATGNDLTGAFTSIWTLSSPSHREQWLTWNNQAIMVDGYNNDVKYDGTSASATNLGAPLATDSGSGSSLSTGNYSYKVSCYTNNSNGSGPFEFSFNVPSNVIASTGHSINLSMIPQCPDQNFLGEPIVGRYIYRTKANGSTYYALTTIADNSTVTYADSTADSSLSSTYPNIASPTESSPPLGILSLIYQGRLWIANNPTYPSRLYYSEIGSQEMFLPSSYFDIRANDGDQITMLQDVLGILTVGKNNSIQKVNTFNNATGQPQVDWSISDPFSFVGCVSPYSVQQTPIGLLYLGDNGIYLFDGNFSTLQSNPVTPVIKDINTSNLPITWSAYYKNGYYLAYTSSSSGGSSNNRVLIWDLVSKAYEIDTANMNSFTVLRGGTDVEILYGGGTNGKVYAYSTTPHQIINRTQADFGGTFTNMWYLPVAGGGDAQNAELSIAQTSTIDALVGTIDSLCGTIRYGCSYTGNYVSSPFDINASSFGKIYWNETLPGGSTTTVAIRTATSDAAISAASWSSEYSNPSGSDISGLNGGAVVQYRISMSTDSLAYSPTVYSNGNYDIEITYDIAQKTDETSIPFEWQSGWLDFNAPAYKKTLRKLYVEYESGGTGTMNITFNNYTGQSASFAVDLMSHPSEYIEYFPNGAFLGELFNVDITESSLNALKIKRLSIVYNIEPLV